MFGVRSWRVNDLRAQCGAEGRHRNREPKHLSLRAIRDLTADTYPPPKTTPKPRLAASITPSSRRPGCRSTFLGALGPYSDLALYGTARRTSPVTLRGQERRITTTRAPRASSSGSRSWTYAHASDPRLAFRCARHVWFSKKNCKRSGGSSEGRQRWTSTPDDPSHHVERVQAAARCLNVGRGRYKA